MEVQAEGFDRTSRGPVTLQVSQTAASKILILSFC